MNIFYLHHDIDTAVEYLCDQHVPKMILETTQLLNNALLEDNRFYRPTHLNHPCSIWVRESKNNALWLVKYLKALHNRYERRGKIHKSKEHIDKLSFEHLPGIPFNVPPQCMPEEYKDVDTVFAYSKYYAGKILDWETRTDKRKISATWETSL